MIRSITARPGRLWKCSALLLAALTASSASALRLGPYAGPWDPVTQSRTMVQIAADATFVRSRFFMLDGAPGSTPIESGPVSSLTVINECQIAWGGQVLTQQACELAYDDTMVALRPDGTVVVPNIFFRIGSAEVNYRVTFGIINDASGAMNLVLSSATLLPGRSRDASPVSFNAVEGRLNITVFVPTPKDCIEVYGVNLRLNPNATQPYQFKVEDLYFTGQYNWWGGLNDEVCPYRRPQKLI
jgi:hypothetical protein